MSLMAAGGPRLGFVVGILTALTLETGWAAGPGTVAVVAPSGSRLGEELRRELEISGFAVVRVTANAGEWMQAARSQLSIGLPRAVAVRDDERQIIVFARSAASDAVQASLDLQLDADDRLTRRRTCLTVVEFLRVEAESQAKADAQPSETTADGHATTAGARPTSPAPAPPPSLAAPAPPSSTSTVDSGPPPQSPSGWARPEATASVTTEPRRRATVAADAPSDPAIDFPSTSVMTPEWARWTMGVGTTLDLASRWSRPAGHLQFMWYFPLTPRLSIRARVHWPILGADFQADGDRVRMWMFGVAAGLQYCLTDAPRRWRPFLGVAAGNRLQLTEITSGLPVQSRTGFTPSATLSLEGGLRYLVTPRFQLLGELEVARDWVLSTLMGMDQEIAAANVVSFHASIGALFEY